MGWGVFVDEGDAGVRFQSTCCDLTPLGACVLKHEMDAGISMFYPGRLSPSMSRPHNIPLCIEALKLLPEGSKQDKVLLLLFVCWLLFFLPPNLNNFTGKGDTSYSFPVAGKIREKDM